MDTMTMSTHEAARISHQQEGTDTMDMPARQPHEAAASRPAVGNQMQPTFKDPVCGMAVTVQSAHHLEHAGQPFYFCSAGCKSKFAANPLTYLAKQAAPPTVAVAAPTDGASVAQDTVYTCPMHPEIRQDHPGNCPKCGMTLEPVMPSLEEGDSPELIAFTQRF